MKNKHKSKLGPLGIIAAVLLMAFAAIYMVSKTDPSYIPFSNSQNSDLKTYTSTALKISFKYPKDWRTIEYPNVIVVGNDQASLNFGNNVDLTPPTKERISIKISIIHLLQNQSLPDYIKEVEKNSISNKSIESMNINGVEAIVREISYSVNNNELLYRYLYLERNNEIYSISATPADSELIPEFNQIVNSIEFK